MFTTHSSFPNMALLRQFVEVAQERGIARAARNLEISQPALSKNLKRLEESIGATLFDRHSKGTVLTRAGEALHLRAMKILLDFEHAMQEVHNAMGDDQGLVRIGAGAVFASTIIPAALPRFLAHYPKFRVAVQANSIEDARQDLELGRVDIVAGVIREGANEQTFHQRPVRRADLTILGAAAHPLANAGQSPSLSEVARYPFVSFRPDHDLIRKLAQVFREAGAPPPRYQVETSSLFGALELVRGGQFLMYGSSLLTDFAIGHGLVSLPVAAPLGSYTMGFILLAGRERIPAYRGFMNVVQQEVARERPPST